MMHVINESGILDMLIPPITSYTQSKSDDNVGRPSKSISDVGDGNAGESTEASIDSKGEA
jgi:hypothetical protein